MNHRRTALRLDKGPGRILKLLCAAVLIEKVFAGLVPPARFALVFLSVLVADSLRIRTDTDSPVYLEDVVAGVLTYAGVGLLCWALDYRLALHTGKHADPIVPALLFAVIDRAWPAGRFSAKGR